MHLLNNLLTILAGLLMLMSGIPQIIKLLKTEKSNDISLSTYLITANSVFILTYLSYIEKDFNLFYVNLVSLFIMFITLFLIILYRR